MASANPPDHHESSFLSRVSHAVSNVYKKLVGSFESQIKNGRSPMDMPMYPIAQLSRSVVACNTGPYGGLCQLEPDVDHPTHDRDSPVAGISNWYRPHPVADGDSITLYEHKPGNTQHHGDPIADVFSIIARSNNCILAVADGVNWGIKPRLAARCAIHGAMDHLNTNLFNRKNQPRTIQDVFHCILRSFHSGQKMIVKHGGTTTTLCVAVVVELHEPRGGSKWGLCVVSVGDSLCFVWRGEVQMVYEITSAMHSGKERNPRDCGGCLGCNLGDQPDLSNLLCSFVPLADDDIVFIVSDGVSDNSDPVILKEAQAEGQPISPPVTPSEPTQPILGEGGGAGAEPRQGEAAQGQSSDRLSPPPAPSLPIVTPEQRQALILMKLTSILKNRCKKSKASLNAQDVRDTIINYVIDVTEKKREYLERCWVEIEKPDITISERRANERKIAQHIKTMPGKLDHATVTAYKVGKWKWKPVDSHDIEKEAELEGDGGRTLPSPSPGGYYYEGHWEEATVAKSSSRKGSKGSPQHQKKVRRLLRGRVKGKKRGAKPRDGKTELKKSQSCEDVLGERKRSVAPLRRVNTVNYCEDVDVEELRLNVRRESVSELEREVDLIINEDERKKEEQALVKKGAELEKKGAELEKEAELESGVGLSDEEESHEDEECLSGK